MEQKQRTFGSDGMYTINMFGSLNYTAEYWSIICMSFFSNRNLKMKIETVENGKR